MVTLGQLFGDYKPGLVFGAIVGLAVNMVLRFQQGITNEWVLKVLELDRSNKGLVIVPVFAVSGIIFQRLMRWR